MLIRSRTLWYYLMAIVLFLFTFAPACKAPNLPQPTEVQDSQWKLEKIRAVVDEKYDVVCFIYKLSISCVPLSQTRRGE